MRRDAKPPKAKVGAKPTGARKSRKNDGSRVRDLEKRLEEALQREAEAQRREAEALEQQTAAAEILRVISSSPTDVQPVFDSIAKNGTTLCDAAWGAVIRFDGQLLTLMAQHNMTPSELELLSRTYPRTPTRGRATGRAIIDRRTVHVPDIREDPDYLSPFQQALGFRTVLAVPMLRDGEPIGVLALWRREVRPFTDQQIALMETFADQAVIAIENVRLFRELESRNRELSQALDQQTATSEILRIIGSSPTDAQPVFETIARSAVTVCAALGCAVFIVDGDLIRVAATHGVRPERVERFRVEFPQPLTSDYFDGARIIRERSLFHLADIERNPNATVQDVEYARLGGYRTRLMVPMVRGQSSVGLIAVTREAPTAFTDQQVDLL